MEYNDNNINDIETIKYFINESQQYKHYEFIQPKPTKFDNWQDDEDIKDQYANWISDKSGAPTLKFDLPNLPVQDMVDEAYNASEYFIKHRHDGHPNWFSMALHAQGEPGSGSMYTDNPRYYPGVEQRHSWTELAEFCPRTTEWFKDVWPSSDRLNRIRFMLLRPGGWIGIHSDTGKGIWRLMSYNIALTNPSNCLFAQEKAGTVPWEVGDIRFMDVARLHCVYNDTDQDRLHMIVLDDFNESKHDLACNGYDKLIGG